MVINNSLIGLRLVQQEGNHDCFWKPRVSEILDLVGEPTTAILHNEYNS